MDMQKQKVETKSKQPKVEKELGKGEVHQVMHIDPLYMWAPNNLMQCRLKGLTAN